MSQMDDAPDGIAVVGMSGRFPGAHDVPALWQALREGREGMVRLDAGALEAAGAHPALLRHPGHVGVRGAPAGVELFDAGFFGFTPAEAALTGPDHRLFLECAWEALESAGHALPGRRVGVFGGAGMSGYFLNHVLPALGAAAGDDFFQLVLANAPDHLATRVAYRLDLRGPCLTVQTACSTSLVAVHLACQSLLAGECDTALAGGATIAVPDHGYVYQEGGILSPDGHCRPFDAAAAGTVPGSGVAMVALRRLEDALADGDPIHAVIRGSAINNDGAAKVGYTAPSVEGQAAVIAEALAVAGVERGTVRYVETHGTGTPIGDPIEVAALARVYGAGGAPAGSCVLGSVKGNLGHLDAAAGAAGLIKAVLSVEHGHIPPTLHFTEPNPAIDFARTPFVVSARGRGWPSGDGPRRAAVSSFGMGGTNAHVVVEEAPPRGHTPSARPWQLLPLSAKTPAALDAASAALAAWLRDAGGALLADAAWTLQSGRQAFAERRVLLAPDAAAGAAALEARDPERVRTGRAPAERRSVVFLFPGQGAQHVGMGAELYHTEPAFRAAVDRCAALLAPRLGFDLRAVLYPPAGGEAEAGERLRDTAVTQPAVFTVEYALATLWMEWGVAPQAMLGHSVGEYVAATLAGVFRLEDALAVVAERGRMMGALPRGAMLSVELPASEAEGLLDPGLALAADNGPAQCVVAGPEAAVAALEAALGERGVRARRLRTSHAFHSAMMDPVLEAFAAVVAGVPRAEPRIPFLSNLTGTWIRAEEAVDPAYWAGHLRHAVRFREGLLHLRGGPGVVLLEVGPGQTLCALADSLADEGGAPPAFASLRHPRDADGDAVAVHRALGGLWLEGVEVDWAGYWTNERRRSVTLPTYRFQRTRHWIEGPRAAAGADAAPSAAPGLLDLSAAGALPAAGSALEWLIGEQIKLMARQLHLAGGVTAPPASAPATVSTPITSTPITSVKIASVPTAAESIPAIASADSAAGDDVPLTPVQRWFFGLAGWNHAHFNFAALFGETEPLDVLRLRRAALAVAEHHDALRMRYAPGPGGVRAWPGGAAESVAVTVENLSGVHSGDRDAAMERIAAAAQAGLDLAGGPLMRLVAFDPGAGPWSLLVVLHHAAVDVHSWGIVLRDLDDAYRQLGRGAALRLPPPTTPFADWARRLAAYARSGALHGEEAFWTGVDRARARPLPRVAAPGRNTGAAARTLEQSLDAGETRRLLKRAAPAGEAQVNDVLLAALAPALAAWAGGPVAVDMEGHGREDLFPAVDLSRSVGWFTAIHPVVLEQGAADEDAHAAVRRVRDLLRAVPDGGIGYGLLRFSPDGAEPSPRLAAIPPAEALFHYAGVMDPPGAAGEGLFGRPLAGPTGPAQDPGDERPHLLEISCVVRDGRLHATWRWAGEVLDGGAVAAVADAFLRRLRELVRSLGADPAASLPLRPACTTCRGADTDRPATCPGICGPGVALAAADPAAPPGDSASGR